WEADVGLTNDPDDSWYPSIAVRDAIVHVVWVDGRDGNWEIYYKHSVDNGSLWYSDERLTNAAGDCYYSSVACWDCSYNADVHVAWTDERDGNQEIYYKRHLCDTTSGIEESKKFRVESRELRVSSNPFITTTVISYQVPVKGRVSLNVYDLCGRVVRTLVNEEQFGGYYSVDFPANDLGSGIYFVTLATDGYKETKKLTILK
ncbi:MAG: T9SS type A sorting domain-containing protein, partial [Candidatus Stahlbacteria bacterium]|nr:T9SS type A sorting domain-containing protein [Candidatus Stahlbacteria bacterium]